MSEQNMGGPAFPPNAGWRDNDPDCRGATLWDYYAASVLPMAAALHEPDEAAELAARYADAMLRERSERTTNHQEEIPER